MTQIRRKTALWYISYVSLSGCFYNSRVAAANLSYCKVCIFCYQHRTDLQLQMYPTFSNNFRMQPQKNRGKFCSHKINFATAYWSSIIAATIVLSEELQSWSFDTRYCFCSRKICFSLESNARASLLLQICFYHCKTASRFCRCKNKHVSAKGTAKHICGQVKLCSWKSGTVTVVNDRHGIPCPWQLSGQIQATPHFDDNDYDDWWFMLFIVVVVFVCVCCMCMCACVRACMRVCVCVCVLVPNCPLRKVLVLVSFPHG